MFFCCIHNNGNFRNEGLLLSCQFLQIILSDTFNSVHVFFLRSVQIIFELILICISLHFQNNQNNSFQGTSCVTMYLNWLKFKCLICYSVLYTLQSVKFALQYTRILPLQNITTQIIYTIASSYQLTNRIPHSNTNAFSPNKYPIRLNRILKLMTHNTSRHMVDNKMWSGRI